MWLQLWHYSNGVWLSCFIRTGRNWALNNDQIRIHCFYWVFVIVNYVYFTVICLSHQKIVRVYDLSRDFLCWWITVDCLSVAHCFRSKTSKLNKRRDVKLCAFTKMHKKFFFNVFKKTWSDFCIGNGVHYIIMIILHCSYSPKKRHLIFLSLTYFYL